MLQTRPIPAWWVALILLTAALVTAACGGSAAPAAKSTAPSPAAPAAAPAQQGAPPAANSASAPTPSAPRELVKLRIGVPSIDSDALPVTLPLKKGYFADEGLDVEVIRIAANNAVTATTVGELELSTTIGSTVVAASQGYPLRVIAVVHGMPMDAVVGRRDARSLNDLRGGRVAVSSPGATIDLLGRAAVKQVGLDPDQDVAMLGIGEESNRYNALQLGQVDAAVLGPPLIYEAEAEGFPILLDIGELVPIAMNGLVAHETTLRDRPDLVKRFLRAYIRGLQFIRQERAETVRFVAEAEGLSDLAIAEKTYDRMLKSMSDDAMAPESTITRYVQLAKDAGRISNEPGGLASLDYTLTREAWREVQR